MPQLLTPEECAHLAGLDDEHDRFRSTVDMARYRFGQGQHRCFDRPFPETIEALKQALYPALLLIARDWWAKLGRDTDTGPAAGWPDTLDEWLARCHDAGQTKSTPILLKYGPGDWNALHRDLYGDLAFPLQVVINLNEPASTTPAGSSCWSSSGPGPSLVARPRSSPEVTG